MEGGKEGGGGSKDGMNVELAVSPVQLELLGLTRHPTGKRLRYAAARETAVVCTHTHTHTIVEDLKMHAEFDPKMNFECDLEKLVEA